jgi:hypothetical protein
MNAALGYLRHQTEGGNVNTIGLRAKVVLAADAAGKDPRDFGSHNLLKEIRSTLGSNGRYDGAAVFDDALVVLAVVASGTDTPAKASTWLLDAQCPDGGWAYDAPYDSGADDAHCHSGDTDFFDADSNTTSYVMQALAASGTTTWAADPFAFLDTVRDPDHGGWSYAASFVATDTNSTALVIQAYVAMGTALPSGARKALRDLQYSSCGAWAYTWADATTKGDPDVGATIGAIPGLLREPFPISGSVAKGGVGPPPICL